MKIFLTSDTHFSHESMIRNSWRKFKSVQEMNELLIKNWNSIVSKEDTVYHLGDVAMNKKEEFYSDILPRLNGKIVFVKGNHDNNRMSCIESCVINFQGYKFELVHKPLDASGSVNYILHGHIHKGGRREIALDTKNIKDGINTYKDFVFYNVNTEFHKYKPKLINEILGEIKNLKKIDNKNGHY